MKKKNHVPERAKAFAGYTPMREFQHDRSGEFKEQAWARARDLFRIDRERLKFAYFAGQKEPTPVPDDSPIHRFDEQSNKALRKLFTHMKLDPDDPSSWRLLVDQMAYIFFWEPPGRPRGAPKQWIDEREALLAAEVAKLPGMSAIAIARKHTNDKKSPFYAKGVDSKKGVRGLRARIGKVRKGLARKSAKN